MQMHWLGGDVRPWCGRLSAARGRRGCVAVVAVVIAAGSGLQNCLRGLGPCATGGGRRGENRASKSRGEARSPAIILAWWRG